MQPTAFGAYSTLLHSCLKSFSIFVRQEMEEDEVDHSEDVALFVSVTGTVNHVAEHYLSGTFPFRAPPPTLRKPSFAVFGPKFGYVCLVAVKINLSFAFLLSSLMNELLIV